MSKRKRTPTEFVYRPSVSAFVPGLKPGAIVTAADAREADRLASHPCFSPVPEADTITEPPVGPALQED